LLATRGRTAAADYQAHRGWHPRREGLPFHEQSARRDCFGVSQSVGGVREVQAQAAEAVLQHGAP